MPASPASATPAAAPAGPSARGARLRRVRGLGRAVGGWPALALVTALPALVPLLVVGASLLRPAPDVWGHLAEHVLPELVATTAVLLAGVCLGTLVLGVGLGWLTGACEFPGRRFFAWALLLPLAMPAYVLAFVYMGLLEFTGPVQTFLRESLDIRARIPLRTPLGAAAVLSLAFYPYVYLLARSAFLTQGRRAVEAARTLGLGPAGAFFRVVLPLSRPFIAAGLTLVVMETLADFGAVSTLGVDTFTTAVYKAWFGFFSLDAASQLASLLLLLALGLVSAEAAFRRRMRFTRAGREGAGERIRLSGTRALLACAACALVLAAAFGVPVVQLAAWAAKSFAAEYSPRYLAMTGRTLLLGLTAALATSAAALILAYARRRAPGFFTAAAVRAACTGYALPGTVLAVGVFLPVAWLDARLVDLGGLLGLAWRPILGGSLAVMLGAYVVRFLAAGFGAVESAMSRITPSIDEAARLLGAAGARLILRVHAPMLRTGLLTGMLLVLVDVMKEMPMTLMTRPFGWDTLAVKIFELTSEGEWQRAALPSLVLLAVGLAPVILLTRSSEDPS